MKKFIILDLDGTVSNHDHRFHLAQEKKWDEYHGKCDEDAPYQDVLQMLHAVIQSSAAKIIVCTGRNEAHRDKTVEWLAKFRIETTAVLMRADDDFRKSSVIKIEQLEKYFTSKQHVMDNVLLVLEDRAILTEEFRKYGLPCWQIRDGGK